jgi:flagellum-specific ATP synthase
VGAYKPGSNPRVDEAIAKRDAIEAFLIQDVDDKSTLADTLKTMGEISGVEIPDDEIKAYSKEREFFWVLPAGGNDEEDTEIEKTAEESAPDLPLMDF